MSGIQGYFHLSGQPIIYGTLSQLTTTKNRKEERGRERERGNERERDMKERRENMNVTAH